MQARWLVENVDRLFGAEKRGAVERLLATIRSADAEPRRNGHLLCLESFCALADLGKPSQAKHFTLSMGTPMHTMADGSQKDVLVYCFAIEDMVLAEYHFAFEPRASMLEFVRQVERCGLRLPDDMPGSWCFNDAQIINRLADVLPDEIGMQAPGMCAVLAEDIDDLNVVPDFVGQPHIAMAAKSILLADCFLDHRFDIHFRHEPRQNDRYFLSVRAKIDHSDPKAIAEAPVELYSAALSPDDTKQIMALLIVAIQLRVSNELDEHHAIIDSSAALITKRRDVMTQDPATRRLLTERGDDPAFHGSHYRYLGADAQAQTFSAAFGNTVMVFSNVPSAMGELRGARLQTLLQQGRYRTLNELMATGHRGSEDPILRAAMSTLKNDVSAIMQGLDPEARRHLVQRLDWIDVADTTLGALWRPIAPLPHSKALPAALHAVARNELFSAPVYGAPIAGEEQEENPGPEGISYEIFDQFKGHANWV